MNDENLVQNSNRSRAEVEEINRKGGIASGEVRRKKKTYKAIAEMLGNNKPKEHIIEYLKANGIKDEDITNDVAVIMKQYHKAIEDEDTRAAEYLYKLTGEDVTNIKHEVNTSLTEWKDLIKKALSES